MTSKSFQGYSDVLRNCLIILSNIKLSIKFLSKLGVSIFVFYASLFIGSLYINGDQGHYRAVYDGLKGLNLIEGFIFYTSNLDSKELLHFIFSWFASNLNFDKDYFYSFINGLIAYFMIRLFGIHKVSLIVAISVVLTNFYFLVLYFAAERLKIAFLFAILSLIYYKNGKHFLIYTFLSILSHIQVLIAYGSILFARLLTSIVDKSKWTVANLLYLFLAIIPLYLMSDQIYSKYLTYSDFTSENITADIIRITAFYVMTLWYSRNRIFVTMIFAPIYLIVFFIGGSRVNMIGYLVFLYYASNINHGLNFGMLITGLYFAFKSIDFVSSIYTFGEAFTT